MVGNIIYMTKASSKLEGYEILDTNKEKLNTTSLNPLGPISIQLKKEKCLYKVLTPSIISYI